MSFERVRGWDWVVGVLGVGLIALLSVDWYELPQGTASGFDSFALTDLLLGLLGVLAVMVVVVTAGASRPAVPLPVLVLTVTLSVLMTLVVVVRLVNPPGRNADASLQAGAWLGLVCVLALVLASYRALRDERAPGVQPGPEPERQPVPAPAGPPAERPAAGA